MLKLIQVRDVRWNASEAKIEGTTYSYEVYQDSFTNDMQPYAQAITLFPSSTARTHIMLRDEKGRFVSFRNQVDPICAAVESLSPLPIHL